MFYQVMGQVSWAEKGTGWNGSRQLPTFYLDSRVQGITDEQHAEAVAQQMVRDIVAASQGNDDARTVTLHAHVRRMDDA